VTEKLDCFNREPDTVNADVPQKYRSFCTERDRNTQREEEKP